MDASMVSTQPQDSQTSSGSRASYVTGTIVNALTGKPLDHVHVRFLAYNQNVPSVVYGAMSDAKGRFSISGVQPSTYLVMLDRAGFIAVPGPKASPAAKGVLLLKPGEQVRDLVLQMTPHSVISGHVFDEYGDPAMGVSVSAIPLRAQTVAGTAQMGDATNDRGEFRIIVPSGRYRIKAQTGESSGGLAEIRTDGTVDSKYVETYYPSSANHDDGLTVEAKPGSELHNVDVQLARAPALSIKGRVTNLPAGANSFGISMQWGPNSHRITSGTGWSAGGQIDGKFEFAHLSPGFYRLYAQSVLGDKKLQSTTAELTLTDSNADDVELDLLPGAEVDGAVEWRGVAGPQKLLAEKRTVKLQPLGFIGDSMLTRPSDLNADGSFKIADVFPNRYRVVLEPMLENSFLKSVQINGTAAADGILDFSGGVGGNHLKIIVSLDGGQLSGQVTDDKGAMVPSFAYVMLAPDRDYERDELRSSELSSQGTYKFIGLPPGHYRVWAERRDANSRDIDEDWKKHYGNAEAIEIKEGTKIIRDIKVTSDEDENESTQ
jgi:5-hydroxyisourate hydrolase-like protein (transthyretin family)